MQNTPKSIYKALAEVERENGTVVLCTVISSRGSTPREAGSKMLVYPDGRTLSTIGGGEMEARVLEEASQAFVDGRTRTLNYRFVDPEKGDPGVCGGEVEVFLEPIKPTPEIIIVGVGHVGRAVAHLAHWLGFRVIVSDDRTEMCTPEAIPEADQFFPVPIEELVEQLHVTTDSYIVLTTRSLPIDVAGLPKLLESPAAYIGVIGSRRRWETAREMLAEAGISEERLDGVLSPIGLELNAETPEEIAVSVIAEIIMVMRGGDGERMSFKGSGGE